MSESTYSVHFTGIWLNEATAASRLDLLRRLFPHADHERLEHFLDHRRVLLIHGESLEAAKRIVMTLYEHGLECEIAEDADIAPDVRAVMAPPATPPKSAATPPPASIAAPMPSPTSPHADEFTPRGQKFLRALIAITAILIIAASWSAWHRLHRGSAAALTDIPSVCAADTETNWYGGTRAQVLACTARTASGARYRLTLRCDRGGALRATLAFSDPTGAPRAPAWDDATGAAQRSIRYSSGNAIGQSILLRRADAAHVGEFTDADAATLARVLAASFLDLNDVFADETVHFDFEAARWYIDYFTDSCGLTQPAG